MREIETTEEVEECRDKSLTGISSPTWFQCIYGRCLCRFSSASYGLRLCRPTRF